jgi:hypothetical protein
MKRLNLFWPIWIVVSGLLCGLLYLFAPASTFRLLVALLFLLTGPGMSLIPFLHLSDWMNELMLGIALSLTLDTLFAAAALYAGAWDPAAVLWVLIGLSWVGAALQLWQARRPAHWGLSGERRNTA